MAVVVSCSNGSSSVSIQTSDDTSGISQSAVASQQVEEEKPLTKEDFLRYARLTLPAYSKEQCEVLENEIIPLICYQVAEKFKKDFEKIMKDYTGLGGIKIKPSYPDFREAWVSNFDFNDYRNLIDKYLNEYNNTLKDFYTDFCRELEIGNISMKYPECFAKFDIPKDNIEKYVDEEMRQFYWDMADLAVDGALCVADVFSGGALTPVIVAKWMKTGWDVGTTVDELFLDDSIEESEKLEIAVAESFLLMIDNYLRCEYERFFASANNQIYNNINSK